MAVRTRFHFMLQAASVLLLVQLVSAQSRYQQTNLVSDLAGQAVHTDAQLVNAWGLARSDTSFWWVSDNGTGVATLYNGSGAKQQLVVTIPLPMGSQSDTSAPTGAVFNSTQDFEVNTGHPALFIFVTEDGTIAGWNPMVDMTHAQLLIDHSADEAIYKGVTIAKHDGKNYLYAANFHSGQIEIYDAQLKPATLSGSFSDPELPGGYGPFNVQAVDGFIFVMFAQQDENKEDEVAGPGKGFVDIFDTGGTLVGRLEHGDWLDAPWGVAVAPGNFGRFSNHLLIGNFGSGMIAVYDRNGTFDRLIPDKSGNPITIDGLWALGFGNGANAGPKNVLFFTAGINDEKNGLFGTITPIRGSPNDDDVRHGNH